jgi:hypothetical protein
MMQIHIMVFQAHMHKDSEEQPATLEVEKMYF